MIDNSKYCDNNQELNKVKCVQCQVLFVHRKEASNKEYKPSTKQVVYACYNVNDCHHAYCCKCWVRKSLNSSNKRTRSK